MSWHKAERRDNEARQGRCPRRSTTRAGSAGAACHHMFEIVLFNVLYQAVMEASIEYGFDTGVHVRLQRPKKQIVQFMAVEVRHAVAKRLETIPVGFRSERFAADQRRKHHGKYRTPLAALSYRIGFHQPAQIAHKH